MFNIVYDFYSLLSSLLTSFVFNSFSFSFTMSNSKLSGAQRRKLQKEKDDKHNNVMTKVKKLDHFFNVLPSNESKISKSSEATPSSSSSVTESDDSNVKGI